MYVASSCRSTLRALLCITLLAAASAPSTAANQTLLTGQSARAGGSFCGDGLPGPGEQCDDFNNISGDGCSAACTLEVQGCSEASGTSAVNDPGFENGGLYTTGQPNPDWAETGEIDGGGGQVLTPICEETACLGPDSDGFTLEGTHFAWFGGVNTQMNHHQSVSQLLRIPTSSTQLEYWIMRAACTPSGNDRLDVSIDGTVVQTVFCTTTDAEWKVRSVNLATAPGGPYNNNAFHTVRFEGQTNSNGAVWSSIFLDFANTTPIAPSPTVCNAQCGNGAPNGPEQCDDGNTDNGDGCSAVCQVEAGFECTAALPGGAENAVMDGSFELGGVNSGSANPFWIETDTLGFLPICSEATCGLDFAHDGQYYTQSGGVSDTGGAPGVSGIIQLVSIPSGASTLSWQTQRGNCSSPQNDSMTVSLDGNVLDTLVCNTTDANYSVRSINLTSAPGGPYNDNNTHALAFSTLYTGLGAGDFTTVFMDDVQILTGNQVPPTPSVCAGQCYSDDFDLGGDSDLSGWVTFNTGTNTIQWGTTDDGFCGSGNVPEGNFTGGDGHAACFDSDRAGPGEPQAYLCSINRIDFSTTTSPTLNALVNYQIFGGPTPEDQFAILLGTATPGPGTVGQYTTVFSATQNLGTFAGTGADLDIPVAPQNAYVCFLYNGNFDWYVQLDNFGISAADCDLSADSDNDGIANASDNCTAVHNADQRDTDNDGFGNLCDADFDNDCDVNFVDFSLMKDNFFGGEADTDMDGNGITDFADLQLLKNTFFGPPGPGALPNLCDP